MVYEDNEIIDGGVTEPEEDKHAAGKALAAACAAAGINVSFGSLNSKAITSWWDQQALKYQTAEDLLNGYGISGGGTATTKHNSVCGIIIADPDSEESGTIFDNNDGFEFVDADGNDCSLKGWQEIVYYEGYVHIVGLVPMADDYLYVQFGPDGYVLSRHIQNAAVAAVTGAQMYVENNWVRLTPGGFYLTSTEINGEYYVNFSGFRETFIDFVEEERKDIYWNEEYVWSLKVTLPVSEEVGITISYDTGGGGGGGAGGGGSTVLRFTANGGISGRHCDLLNGSSSIGHPSARYEKPSYGSGGYGGHGGGGGAGAATVVIRKFTSGKADSVEQIAVVCRHGYGSGGGAGGMGGDGCILVFW